ncbi:phosphatase PAP2 family protein [Amorphus orientalis]|uniref:Undecaprenyl-diphosphatase n=1 Tax=Amorphus orientalis TaxID=649198 RepID=A0AAE3VL87_9HYPH|nr:phosphatase PAP2 family protein [Amorphus orientalis]MDQ0314116.1 undecaprenyl-diphosphatase [Amorphus orientalis]
MSHTSPPPSRLPRSFGEAIALLRTRFGWNEFVMLAALFVVAAGLWGFAEIVDEVLEGESHEFDEAIMLALRTAGDTADPIGPPALEIAMRDITALGSFPVLFLIGAIAVGYLVVLRSYASALLVIVSLVGGSALNTVLKQAFARPRPDLVAHLVDVHTLSLPSGHAMLSTVTYLTIGALLARVQPNRLLKIYTVAVAVALALLVGISRVYLGVHWPTDVLSGWCLGAAWAMACWLVARFVGRLRSPSSAAPRA